MAIKKWKLLGSKSAFKNHWWNIVQETVELPDGSTTADFYVNRMPGGVAVFALTDDGRILLNRQYKHGYGDIIEELTIGMTDAEDADPLSAAKRELLEETGYGGGTWEELAVLTSNPTSSTTRLHFFLAKGVKRLQEPKADPREVVETSLVTAKELWDKAVSGKLATDPTVAAVFLAFSRLGWIEPKL